MDKIVYLLYPLTALALLAGAKYSGKGKWSDDFLSLSQTKNIQGFLAICIMLHHVAQETCGSWQPYPLIHGLDFFIRLGYLFVAFFFFCSGYGLTKNYINKQDYLKDSYFKKRVLPIITAFYITELIYLAGRFVFGEKMNAWKLICYITGLSQANIYGWFAITMPIFYALFYVCFKFIKKDALKTVGVSVGTLIYIFAGTCINHNSYLFCGEWWYNSVILFLVGIIFAQNEGKLVSFMKKQYALKLIVAAALMLMFFRVGEHLADRGFYYGENSYALKSVQIVQHRWLVLVPQMLAAICFVIVILLINLKVSFGNKLLELMGTITLEFYLIHGFVLELFSYEYCEVVPGIVRIKNVTLLTAIVFAGAIPLALLLKKVRRR